MMETRGERWHHEAESNLVRDGLAMAAALMAGWLLVTVVGCASAQAHQVPQDEEPTAEFAYVHDWSEPKVPSGMVRIKAEIDARAAKAEEERVAAEKAEQEAWEAEQAYYADYSASYAPVDNGDGFISEGVRDYNGTTETWYSSNQAYHYRTDEWTADEEGYYRDADGYYVVASEDHAKGEVFETSKGEARVYDGGCESGVVDFYTNF